MNRISRIQNGKCHRDGYSLFAHFMYIRVSDSYIRVSGLYIYEMSKTRRNRHDSA